MAMFFAAGISQYNLYSKREAVTGREGKKQWRKKMCRSIGAWLGGRGKKELTASVNWWWCVMV